MERINSRDLTKLLVWGEGKKRGSEQELCLCGGFFNYFFNQYIVQGVSCLVFTAPRFKILVTFMYF